MIKIPCQYRFKPNFILNYNGIFQIAFATLKGKRIIAPINFKTNSMENPTIRKGRSRSQSSGNNRTTNRASGQHAIRRIHQVTTAMKVFILNFTPRVANFFP